MTTVEHWTYGYPGNHPDVPPSPNFMLVLRPTFISDKHFTGGGDFEKGVYLGRFNVVEEENMSRYY